MQVRARRAYKSDKNKQSFPTCKCSYKNKPRTDYRNIPKEGAARSPFEGTGLQGVKDTHILPHVILGAHQVFHVCPQLFVLPLKLLLGLQGLLEGPGQGQGFGFFLSGLCFSTVSLFSIASRYVLLFC